MFYYNKNLHKHEKNLLVEFTKKLCRLNKLSPIYEPGIIIS
jgi:hypothetical protein